MPETSRKRLKRKPSRPPPSYWDNLSKIWLTSDALEELDRRNSEVPAPSRSSADPAETCSPSSLRQIKELSQQGGPDLSDLRNFPYPACPQPISAEKGQKRRADSPLDDNSTRATTSIYNGNFEQDLIDHGIYPHGYEYPDGQLPAAPDNLDEINETLARRRPSLSPSRYPDSEFQQFKQTDAATYNGAPMITPIIRTLEGNASTYCMGGGCLFEDLALLVDRIRVIAKPDHYFGARQEQLDPRARDELGDFIIHSMENSSLMASNFFLEAKGPERSLAAATRQVRYFGALGARAMHKLQCYMSTQDAPYDNKAYTITATYHGGQLKLYATHPVRPKGEARHPEYIMTQLNAWSMSGNAESFRQGIAAYRNARDWAKEQRNRLIGLANQRYKEARRDREAAGRSDTPATSVKAGIPPEPVDCAHGKEAL